MSPAVPQNLRDFFLEHNKIALAFSGGVDSAYLLYAALQSGARVTAYYAETEFQPEFERRDARMLARSLGAEMRVIPLEALKDERVAKNGPERCYFCKHNLFSALIQAARADGFSEIMDGTNASDDALDRPGMRALQEMKVLSPLRSCGLHKARIRALSKEAGLFTFDKPAYACLATRIPTGTAIEPGALQRVERAEAALMEMGFSDLRVRIRGGLGLIQLPGAQLERAMEIREQILGALGRDFEQVALDLNPRPKEK